MPVQHSLLTKNTRSQINPAVCTPTARDPLGKEPPMKGTAPYRRGGMKHRRSTSFSGFSGGYPGIYEGAKARLGEVGDEKEDSGETEVEDALENAPETEPSLLKMMEQMTQFMRQLTQSVTPRANFKAPAFKTPSMKAPDYFDGTQAHKLRGFIQSCELIFHNDPANLFSDRKKFLYSNPFLTGRAGKWIVSL
ncbi:hypothetical protein O181_084565 [Austropuccinia psidii MF-1]|uniref:Uncharacterized protein n=1 Tax=Austropuccinia psidii MF-1 TaxID=1389203 RepID=A0A9Q3FVV6_9BASI|nr:hypothetical protein [Austropuccinia psidii MF-1]